MCRDERPSTSINPDRIGVRLDIMERVIGDLNQNAELQGIFGVPVSKALLVVADGNDLRIEVHGDVELTPEQSQEFVSILEDVIQMYSK